MIERYRAVECVAGHVAEHDLLLSTTGMISRELFAAGDRPSNFYMLGSMGLLSAFGLGLALLFPGRRVFVLEGDGSALMSLGTLALISAERPPNLVHLILDNGGYESTGGQRSISADVELEAVGRGCGYREVLTVWEGGELRSALSRCNVARGPYLLVVKARMAPADAVPRVPLSPEMLRDRFRSHVLGEG